MSAQVQAPASRVFSRRALPWTVGSLAPVISSRTIQFHYERHHAIYVQTANRLSRGRPELASMNAIEIVEWSRRRPEEKALFNAAAQACNHALFWNSLCPQRKRPTGALLQAVEKSFGSFADLAMELAARGAAQFGSGWLWLVADRRRKLRIVTTANADRPVYKSFRSLLVIDLWEHAYYFDHQDRRLEYLEGVIDRRIDWDFAASQFRLRPGQKSDL
jgi:Fe-Mn family superoxide dismutase